MSRRVVTVAMDDTLRNVKDICIPIVDSDQHPVGILSWRDVRKQFAPPGRLFISH